MHKLEITPLAHKSLEKNSERAGHGMTGGVKLPNGNYVIEVDQQVYDMAMALAGSSNIDDVSRVVIRLASIDDDEKRSAIASEIIDKRLEAITDYLSTQLEECTSNSCYAWVEGWICGFTDSQARHNEVLRDKLLQWLVEYKSMASN